MSPLARRLALLALVLVVFVAVGWRSWRAMLARQASAAVCDAAAERRWADAIAASEGLEAEANSTHVLAAIDCRALALVVSGRGEAAGEELAAVLAQPAAADWLPNPLALFATVRHLLRAGEVERAAELARQGSTAYPDAPEMLVLEIEVRSLGEDEGQVLAEVERRIATWGDAAWIVRAELAARHLRRGDGPRAAAALGPDPPAAPPTAVASWFTLQARAAGSQGDLAGLRRVVERWSRAGGAAPQVAAVYGYVRSLGSLGDPVETVELLRAAVANEAAIGDPALIAPIYERLIGTLAVLGRHDEAMVYLERASTRWPMPFDRASLLRMGQGELGDLGAPVVTGAGGRLRFVLAPDTAAGFSGRLWVSPPADLPADAEFQALPIVAGDGVAVLRQPTEVPVRWVLEDSAGLVRGSGTVWPAHGDAVEVEIAVRPAAAGPAGTAPGQTAQPVPLVGSIFGQPADGRRRVFVVIPDCGDWRISRYLLKRQELPVLARLLSAGRRAVLGSRPAYTAAAMTALVEPDRDAESASVAAVLYELGAEIAGLTFVGTNPLAGLGWVLPESTDLFSTLGATHLSAANMLHSEGRVRAGRHAVVSGPHGGSRELPRAASRRALTAAELAQFPGLGGGSDTTRELIAQSAAELDTLRDMAAGSGQALAAVSVQPQTRVDLVLARVPQLDLLTHQNYAAAVRAGQDDGDLTLLWIYRYYDHRLGEIVAALDADDVLIVMSDHGIRSALEHDPQAMFVAVAAGLAPGRVPGEPALGGVPRLLADLLGIDTNWPATGLEALAVELR